MTILNRILINNAGTLALAASGSFPLPGRISTSLLTGFNVPEEKMLCRFTAQFTLDDAVAAEVVFGMELDGVALGAAVQTYDNLLGTTSGLTVRLEWFEEVAKGEHTIELVGDASAGGNTIDSTLTPVLMTVERVSNGAMVEAQAKSKSDGIY